LVVLSDDVKLRQVLINLLGNALKFTEVGAVTLSVTRVAASGSAASPDGHALRFAVTDTGIGIAPADQERIFEPFRQGSGAFVTQGTGLGLAISQRIVGLMGGTIQVESTPRRGSRFWFDITMRPAEHSAARPIANIVAGYHGQRRRLLVVDDEPANREVLRGLLEPLGFGIEECGDGRACVAAFERQSADAVLLDLRMPGELDGYATARALRALPDGRAPAIIAVSASVFEEDRDTALEAGCDAFVPKPFTEERLFGALGDCLDLKWVLQENAAEPARLPVLPSGIAEELRDLARRGDITMLRERLRALESDLPDCRPTLAHLDALASGFQLGRLRQELRTGRSSDSRSPL
jgi:CheY-like chemotaxis protein